MLAHSGKEKGDPSVFQIGGVATFLTSSLLMIPPLRRQVENVLLGAASSGRRLNDGEIA